jgi:glycosyltransferase involved in cell wall biosynthesis
MHAENVTSQPHFSVIITAYQRPDRLREALRSVQDQTYRDFEVIVVDDGSQPPLDGVADEFRADPRIRYLRLENGGPGRARRKGTEAAGGRWLCFLDDDDLYLSRHLATLAPYCGAQQQPVCTAMVVRSADGRDRRAPQFERGELSSYWQRPISLLPFAIPAVLGRREPSSDGWVIEDFEWLCRLIAERGFLPLREATVVNCRHATNRTTVLAGRAHLEERLRIVRELYARPAVRERISGRAFRRQLEHQRLHWARQTVRSGRLLAGLREMAAALGDSGIVEGQEWGRTVLTVFRESFANPRLRRRLLREANHRYTTVRNRLLHPLYRRWLERAEFTPETARIIFGTPRSGSTWLAEMIDQLPGTVVNYEPFHVDRAGIPREIGFGIIPVVDSSSPSSATWDYLEAVLRFGHLNEWTGQMLTPSGVRNAQVQIVKCVRGNQLLGPLLQRYRFSYPPIVLLRHPLSTVVSMLRTFRSRPLPVAKLLKENPGQYARYRPHVAYIQSLATDLERWVAQWCVDNGPVLHDPVIRERTLPLYYERLVTETSTEVQRILVAWSLPKALASRIRSGRASASDHRSDLLSDGWEQCTKAWKLTSEEERQSVQAVLDHFGVRIYRTDDPLPQL